MYYYILKICSIIKLLTAKGQRTRTKKLIGRHVYNFFTLFQITHDDEGMCTL
jgi:hypothetical protein